MTQLISELNIRERHLLARSLFRLQSFLIERSKILKNCEDEVKQEKYLKVIHEVTELFFKLGLTDEDLFEIRNQQKGE